MKIKNNAIILFLMFALNAVAAEQQSQHDISHKEWFEKQMDMDESYIAIYKKFDEELYRCRTLPYRRNINNVLKKLEESHDLQYQKGCFSFKTWTPNCTDYTDQDIRYIREIKYQFWLCEH